MQSTGGVEGLFSKPAPNNISILGHALSLLSVSAYAFNLVDLFVLGQILMEWY